MHQFVRANRLLAYSIAGMAGFVDASGFLAADRYFVSFMSGNTTRLGVELARGTTAALVAGSLIAGFIVGVVTGALVAGRCPHRPKSAVLGLSLLLLAFAAGGYAMGQIALYLGGSVLAMGAINNVFRRDNGASIGVTYMTGALVRMGEGLAGWIDGSGKGGTGAFVSMILWASLASGGFLGATTFTHWSGMAAWAAVGWALLLLMAAAFIETSGDQSS